MNDLVKDTESKKPHNISASELNALLSVKVGNKYTVVQDKDGRLHALRNGEEWRDLVGDNLVLTMAQRIEALEDALNTFVDRVEEGSIRSRKTYSQFKDLLGR